MTMQEEEMHQTSLQINAAGSTSLKQWRLMTLPASLVCRMKSQQQPLCVLKHVILVAERERSTTTIVLRHHAVTVVGRMPIRYSIRQMRPRSKSCIALTGKRQ